MNYIYVYLLLDIFLGWMFIKYVFNLAETCRSYFYHRYKFFASSGFLPFVVLSTYLSYVPLLANVMLSGYLYVVKQAKVVKCIAINSGVTSVVMNIRYL